MSTGGAGAPDYAEIGVTSNFSFLRGASHPQNYVHQASVERLYAIGIADHYTLRKPGVVRAFAPKLDRKGSCLETRSFLIGTRLVFNDGTPDILAYPCDRAAYGRLCRLLSMGKLRGNKE